MEFKASYNNQGKLIVKPIIEKKDGNITVHVPSFKIIEQLKKDLGQGKRGIRNIQSV